MTNVGRQQNSEYTHTLGRLKAELKKYSNAKGRSVAEQQNNSSDILLTKVSQQQYSIDKDRVLEEVRKYSHAKGKSTAEL